MDKNRPVQVGIPVEAGVVCVSAELLRWGSM